MKTEKIFCDICGREGASVSKKDQKYLFTFLDTDQKKDKMKLRDNKLPISVPYFSISYAKKIGNGGIEEVDLCSNCKSDIETAASDATLDLFKKAKKNHSSKSN